MADLDQSSVEADAARAYQDYLDRLYVHFDRHSDAELQHFRYNYGIFARSSGNADEYLLLDHILLTRHTTLCEGCLGRTGCDMCCPPDFDMADMYPGYDDQTAHYERFGRPALPNEY